MGRSKKKTIIIILLACLITAISVFLTVSPKISSKLPSFDSIFSFLRLKNRDSGDRIVFIDVGQGDCALIISGDHAALIDCGTGQDDGYSVLTQLKKQNIDKLDYLIISHPHSDHLGGGAAVMNRCKVGCIMMPETLPEDAADLETYTGFCYTADGKGVPINHIQSGDSFTVGNFTLDVLYYNIYAEDENDRSAVIKASANGFSALFTGDITSVTEYAIMAEKADISADVLKVAHHGSSTSTSERFLYSVHPSIGIIPVGENSYGHPTEQTISRLEDYGVKYYRTDVNGNITVFFEGELSEKAE